MVLNFNHYFVAIIHSFSQKNIPFTKFFFKSIAEALPVASREKARNREESDYRTHILYSAQILRCVTQCAQNQRKRSVLNLRPEAACLSLSTLVLACSHCFLDAHLYCYRTLAACLNLQNRFIMLIC